MTANPDQIQRLLDQVQEVLAQANPRLPWGTAAQIARQRQVLEQVHAYLQDALFQLSQATPDQAENQAQAAVQTVIEEMNALRSTLLHPLHAEVSGLMQQRNTLLREIRQLEAHQEFLQSSLAASQTTKNLPAEILPTVSDQMLSTLDASLHVVFESLQKDIQAYHSSLAQGLDKLHRLGQESEVMFSGVVDRLTTQIGQTALVQSSPEQNQIKLSMPYAGSELPPDLPVRVRRELATKSRSIDSIAVLTELIDQLSEYPVTVQVLPPRSGVRSGQEVLTELRSLFEGNAPQVEPAIEPNGYHNLDRETAFEQLRTMPASSEAPAIFSLDGVENLFDDDADHH
ncbi:hypothetical protein H6F89_00565 [Cyanobacteria bacterium FACHB-63]|nr:hypothetical protein [Cyanobacteria bacterium FACHB-63]